MLNLTYKIGRSPRGPAVFVSLAAAMFLACAYPAPLAARTAALSASWSGLQSDILDWPSDQLGLRSYIGPFGKNLYLVPGIAGARDTENDVTSTAATLCLHYMLPAGDRLVPFIEAGVAGVAMRVDVLDFTGGDPPEVDRTTYLRGGLQLGAGVDLALGGSWSVTAAIKGTWLSDVDTELVLRGDKVISLSEDPSYWELPRIAIVYWY